MTDSNKRSETGGSREWMERKRRWRVPENRCLARRDWSEDFWRVARGVCVTVVGGWRRVGRRLMQTLLASDPNQPPPAVPTSKLSPNSITQPIRAAAACGGAGGCLSLRTPVSRRSWRRGRFGRETLECEEFYEEENEFHHGSRSSGNQWSSPGFEQMHIY